MTDLTIFKIQNLRPHLFSIACHFGWATQSLKFIEEVGECLVELSNSVFNANRFRRQHLIEELADVYIVLLQLPMLLDRNYQIIDYFEMPDGSLKRMTHEQLFWSYVNFKLCRTKDRMESGYYDKDKGECTH